VHRRADPVGRGKRIIIVVASALNHFFRFAEF
jgi:hypothetical protein